MNPREIHTLLKERFGEAVRDWTEPEVGDSSLDLDSGSLHDVCVLLRDDSALRFDFLRLVSAVDRTDRIECVYHLWSYELAHSAALRVELDRSDPRVASLSDVWPTAEWHEREAYDMMGVVFENHPHLHRILLPEDWEGYPLRKDYVAPREYNGLTNE
ncbi:NADH-quinone oxidoreductase subunit C [Candidatus Sumerlaeota bacterium]|nr:NADH-quinone oxidoreductase subunit C [Candidatus Sumerlaeota bacterium]